MVKVIYFTSLTITCLWVITTPIFQNREEKLIETGSLQVVLGLNTCTTLLFMLTKQPFSRVSALVFFMIKADMPIKSL